MLWLPFLLALVLVGIVVAHSIRQGRRSIRAAAFLNELDGGRAVAQANAAATLLFTDKSSASADAHAARIARERQGRTGETQAQLIAGARGKGFEG